MVISRTAARMTRMEHMPPVEGAIPKAFPFGEGAERSEADEVP